MLDTQHGDVRVTATLDGRLVNVPQGTYLLAAAQALGKEVPTLCRSERLPPCGVCRVCLVEEAGVGYVPACATKVREGAVYTVCSAELHAVRRGMMRTILRRHPLHCMGCVVDGNCRLQRVARQLGFSPQRIQRNSDSPVDRRHPWIHRDPGLCIHCTLCVQACRTTQGSGVLGMAGRGEAQRVVAGCDDSLEGAGCVSCGQCLFECPTGALYDAHGGTDRPSDRVVSTVCGYCAVGCNMRVHVHNNRIVRMEPDPNGSPNRGHACVKGRFGFSFVQAPDRLRHPWIRQPDGQLKASRWDEALALVAARFRHIRDRWGGHALGVVSSARCSNEENFIAQKFARVVLGTNNIDNCARVCHAPSAFALGEALGTGAGTNSLDDIERSDLLLLVGANPTASHPVLGARIKQAVLKGCRLIVIDPRRTELASWATLHLSLRPGSNLALIQAMQAVLIEENRLNLPFIRDHAEGLDGLHKTLVGCTPAWAESHCDVPAALIRQAVRLYASGRASQILWGLGITEACQGSMAAFGLINLAIMTGNLGRPGTGASPIRGQNNVQGACDMGALPNVFSDYQSVTDAHARKRHEAVWGVMPPVGVGLKLPEMLKGARHGTLKGLYLIAQDPAQSDPNTQMVRQALEGLDFLVVQDLFMSESAQWADVILPGASYLEKSGTFVNSDRRIQRFRKAVEPPGDALPDGDIVHRLARCMGHDLGFDAGEGTSVDPRAVMVEVASLTPNWGGVTYDRLDALGFLQWPVPHLNHPGTEILHRDGRFLRGRARLTVTPRYDGVPSVKDHFPFLLTTGRALFHYNVGSMTRRTAISRLQAARRDSVHIHPVDAKRLDLATGDRTALVSAQGRIDVVAEITTQVKPGLLFMTFHFAESRTNLLIGSGADPHTLCPEYKVTPVRLEKI